MILKKVIRMKTKELDIDYQAKKEELIKEAIFLQENIRPVYEKEKDTKDEELEKC